MSQTTQPFHARESSTAQLTAVVEDETGTAIPGVSLDSMTLHLYNQKTELASPGTTDAVINGRYNQNILNANGGTVDSSGRLVMVFTPADNQIIDTGKSTERHVALFGFTYAAGLKAGKEEVLIDVTNYARTT
jgi:hypothetical protein